MGIKVIPVMIEDSVELANIHSRIAQYQAIKLYENKWDELVKALHQEKEVQGRSKAAQNAIDKAMTSSNSRERQQAVNSLAQRKDVESLASLIQNCEYPDVRIAAGFKLAELTDYTDIRATRGLLESLDDKTRGTRCHSACEALGKIGDPSAVSKLLETLSDESRDQLTRFYVMNALKEIDDESVVYGLVEIFAGLIDVQVRHSIIHELARRKHRISISILIEALHETEQNSRQAAVRALGEMGDEQAIPSLIDVVLHDKSRDVKRDAFQALKNINVSIAVSKLIELLGKKKDGRFAHSSLVQFGNDAVPELAKHLHPKDHLRYEVNTILQEIDTSEAWEALGKNH